MYILFSLFSLSGLAGVYIIDIQTGVIKKRYTHMHILAKLLNSMGKGRKVEYIPHTEGRGYF